MGRECKEPRRSIRGLATVGACYEGPGARAGETYSPRRALLGTGLVSGRETRPFHPQPSREELGGVNTPASSSSSPSSALTPAGTFLCSEGACWSSPHGRAQNEVEKGDTRSELWVSRRRAALSETQSLAYCLPPLTRGHYFSALA